MFPSDKLPHSTPDVGGNGAQVWGTEGSPTPCEHWLRGLASVERQSCSLRVASSTVAGTLREGCGRGRISPGKVQCSSGGSFSVLILSGSVFCFMFSWLKGSWLYLHALPEAVWHPGFTGLNNVLLQVTSTQELRAWP